MHRQLLRVVVPAAILCAAAAAIVIALLVAPSRSATPSIALSDLNRAIVSRDVAFATINEGRGVAVVRRHDGTTMSARFPKAYTATLTSDLVAGGATVVAASSSDIGPAVLRGLATALIPILVLVVLLRRVAPQRSFKAGSAVPKVPATRFTDVAGCDEVVAELRELVDTLSEPERFHAVGARPPRGILLAGPPGTGKTLLASATAGEAGVPFFCLSGSDFVEMYAGLGARRVRELFARARKSERAIVFIDEIDAIGRQRTGAPHGGTDERESTLNALLVELDGVKGREHIVVLAATNRPELLDQALLRPGRFDRIVTIGCPDRRGREQILDVHARGKHLNGVDLPSLARRTAGLSGAALANLMNQAALAAARRRGTSITGADVDAAFAIVTIGPERRSAAITERDRTITAWHEAGHAIVAHALDDAPRPTQVTIVPRGEAGGVTFMEGSDHAFRTKGQAMALLATMLGGRAGEELLLGDDTTQGAASDLIKATDLARSLVAELGLGPRGIIPVITGERTELPDDVRADMAALLDGAAVVARATLVEQRALFDELVARLLDVETVSGDELSSWSERAGSTPPQALEPTAR